MRRNGTISYTFLKNEFPREETGCNSPFGHGMNNIFGWDDHNLIERTAAAENESEEETDQIVGGTNVPSKGVYPFMV